MSHLPKALSTFASTLWGEMYARGDFGRGDAFFSYYFGFFFGFGRSLPAGMDMA